MRFRFITGAALLTAVLGLAGCDTGSGGSSPKAETKGVQFKEKEAPAAPGGGGKAPGPAPNAQ
jgi:hypothetical protein